MEAEKYSTWFSIYKYLTEQIKRGDINPGERIDEREISQVLDVSRTPVREALRHLQSEGLISIVPKKGAFVRKYSFKELDDIYTVLSHLEGLALRLVDPAIQEEDLEKLHRMHDQMEKLSAAERYREYLEVNYRFHIHLCTLSGNEVLQDMIAQLRNRVFRYQNVSITLPGRIGDYVKDHYLVVDALKKGDIQLASRQHENHINQVRRAIVEFYKKVE